MNRAVTDGEKLHKRYLALPRAIRGQGATGDAPQRAAGQSNAAFLAQLREAHPDATSDDLTMMLIEGAGHADPAAWPTGPD